MGCEVCSSKTLLFVIGLIFWGIAAGFSYLGIRIWVDYGHINEIATSYYTVVPGATFLAAAILAVVVGILICCSACSENRCLLAVVFSILLAIFLAQVTAAVMGYTYKGKADKMVRDGMEDALMKYGQKKYHEITTQVDYIQEELECCGVDNYTDWRNSTWGRSHAGVPASCYESPSMNSTLHKDGCYSKLHENLKKDLAIIIGVGLGFALLQILGMIAACVLLCRTRRDHIPYEGLGTDRPVSGLRV